MTKNWTSSQKFRHPFNFIDRNWIVWNRTVYKGDICRQLKVRLEEHRKAVVRGEIEKLGMVDHIWKEKGNNLPLWDEVEIIDRKEQWRIRRLKESAHMLGYSDQLSRPSIEMNTILKPIIKRVRLKNRNMCSDKKIIHNSSNYSDARTLGL